ncbi:bifunctional DNA primase/polymerase [Bacillus sp. JJ634]
MNTIQLHALNYLKYGMHTIPVQNRGKIPLVKNWPSRLIKKEEILNGIHEDSNSIYFENINLGILTGLNSGIFVVDVDSVEALQTLTSFGEFNDTWTVKTNRGYHFYFKNTQNVKSCKLFNGVDIQSDGKFVVAPPSFHKSGERYCFIKKPKDFPIANPPKWLLKLLNEKNSFIKQKKTMTISHTIHHNSWYDTFSHFVRNIKPTNHNWFSSSCPFHDDNHNSFAFNKNGAWICFSGCGKGNGEYFILKVEKELGGNFYYAKERK